MSGETLTIHLTTDELKKLIRDEIADVITDRPTRQDVKALVKSEMDSVLTPMLQALDGIRDGLHNFDTRWNNTDRQLALLVQKVDTMNQAVRDVKDEQKRIDDEQDEIKREMTVAKSERVQTIADMRGIVQDIWGTPERQGTGSVIETIHTLFKSLAEQMGTQRREDKTFQQTLMDKITQTETDVNQLKITAEENTRFRQRRQHIEQVVIQSIPNTVKRLAGKLTKEMVVTAATRAGLAGASLFLLWLLGQMQ